MRVLVSGANGFIGSALLRRLITLDGVTAIAGVRRADTLANQELACEKLVLGDLAMASLEAGSLCNIDVVVHTAARAHVMHELASNPLAAYREVNVNGTLHFAKIAAQAGVKRFIFISSVKVNGEETLPGKAFTAFDMPCPLDAYGISKWEAEQALQILCERSGMELVIIRPPLVYGPGVKANFQRLMASLARGIPLPFGALDNRRSLVAIDNLVDLLAICVKHPSAANQVFMVSDGDDMSVAELTQFLALFLRNPTRVLSIPRYWLRFGLTVLGRGLTAQRLCCELRVDIAKTTSLLNWRPSYSVEEALRKTAEHFLSHQEELSPVSNGVTT